MAGAAAAGGRRAADREREGAMEGQGAAAVEPHRHTVIHRVSLACASVRVRVVCGGSVLRWGRVGMSEPPVVQRPYFYLGFGAPLASFGCPAGVGTASRRPSRARRARRPQPQILRASQSASALSFLVELQCPGPTATRLYEPRGASWSDRPRRATCVTHLGT